MGIRLLRLSLRYTAFFASTAGLIALAACGSSDDDSTGAAGSVATGGSGGAAGGGGSSGTSPAGSAGAAGLGGESGSAGSSAGSSGTGGSGGTVTDGGPDTGPDDSGIDVSPDVEPDVELDAPPETDADPNLNPDCDRILALEGELAAAASDAEKVSLTEQVLVDIEQSGGFPVRCAPNATFFFRVPSGWGTPHVAGDFNGWDATASPMVLVAGDLYRLTLPVDTGPHRYLYKFTDGSHWVADSMARRFGFDGNGEYSLVQGGTNQGHLERHFGIAGNGLSSRPLSIYLPPGYETSTTDYPVLYAHDGQNLFDPAAMWGGWRLDESVEQLIASGDIQPLIVVGIHNTSARMDEYTHVQDVVSGQPVGGSGEAYFGLVRTRVMPLVESHYRARTGPENTWTMGSSLGGLISLYFGLKHPDVFGRVAGMSSTLGWGSIGANNPTLMELMPTFGTPDVIIYLDSGGTDGGGCTDSDDDGVSDDTEGASDNYCETAQMRDVLEAAGYEHGVDLFHWHEAGAAHNEAAWAARVALPLQVLATP